MKIEVSHETPIHYLNYSRSYNDYDYALVHLFETHPEYYRFFKESVVRGRKVLLDNSIFELGKAFDSDRYDYWIKELNPNYYIVPDVLMDGEATIAAWEEWESKYHTKRYSSRPLRIGVATGKDIKDFGECYDYMATHADYIAIGFNYTFYNDILNLSAGKDPSTFSEEEQLYYWKHARMGLIDALIESGLWAWDKPHHLLGCSLASEFRYYVDRDIRNIRSCDTSNPIVAAIQGLQYNDDFGLKEKPSIKLADLIDHKLTNDQDELLKYNVNMFRKILRREPVI